jgi:hypothetical protein
MARAPALVAVGSGRAQGVEAGDPDRCSANVDTAERGLGLTCLDLTWVDSAGRPNGDQREGDAAILRDKGPVVSRRVGGHSHVRQRRLDLGEGGCEFPADAG